MPKEQALVNRVLAEFRSRGCEAVKIHGGAFGIDGEPDIHACIAGRFAAVELKQRGKKPTKRQHYRLRRWRESGALAEWFDNFEAFRLWLDSVLAAASGGSDRL